MDTLHPMVVRRAERERYALGGDLYSLIARSGHTGGQFAIYETLTPPGHGAMTHVHSRESESFLMFEGQLTVRLGSESIELAAGDFIHLPPGCSYSFRNHGETPTRFLTLLVPAGLEEFLTRVGEPVAMDTTEKAPTPEGIAAMVRMAREYGVDYPQQPA